MTLLLGSTVARRRATGGTDPGPDPGDGGPDPEPGWTYFTGAGVGPSGLRVPIPPGYKVWWHDHFADRNAMLAASFNGSPVWSVYSGQDGAYASGYWGTTHVTVAGNLLTLDGRFDTSVHATKYVTGGVGAWPFAQGGNAPAGAMWLWCAREEAAGAAPVKSAVMTYGSQYPWSGQFTKNGNAAGSGYAEWPYCGEVDIKEGTLGAGTADTNLHWHDPSLVSSGNPAGHAQVRVGGLTIDTTKWHILGYRVDAAGLYQGWTNDAATTDQPLRKWVEQAGVNEAFRRAGRAWIYQQEAYNQPAAGTGTLRAYVDWVACLVPTAAGIWTPPGAIIDLHQSKLTLPVDATNGTSTPPKEIFNPQLQTYMHGSFFYATPNGDGVVTTANAGGSRTGSSSYPRTEERGMVADSTTEEAFGGNDGKLHTRVITQAITHLPDHRPEIVISQIHGDEAASFLLMYGSGFYPSTPGSTTYVKGGETAPFKIRLKQNALDGSGQVLNVVALTDVHLGDLVSTKYVMGAGKVLVYMDKGDKGQAGATTLVAEITTGIPTSGAYFKDGAYLQSNPNNDGDGKVVPNGTAATGGNLTAPIPAGQPTGDAAVSEYGSVATYFRKTTHTTSGGGGGSDPSTKAPAEVIDLTKQKITLPVGINGELGNTVNAKEVKRTDLDTFKDPTYFYVQQAPDGVDEVVFYAPANGATTSGSGNPRSELRQMTGSAGTTNAAWDSTVQTDLYLVGRILQLPTNKPQAVILQIHDAKDDFTFMADGFSPTDSGTYVHNTDPGGFCIVWRNWAGSQQYSQPVIAGVHIGDDYTVMMRMNPGGNIGIYGGLGLIPKTTLIADHFITTYAGGARSGCFGKAGVYTQANSDNAGKHVPTGHYTGLPTLTTPAPNSTIAGEPNGSGGRTAIGEFTITPS